MEMDSHEKSVNQFTSEDRYYSAIGRFMVEFSQLEFSFKYYVAKQVNLGDQYFNAIMSHDFSRLCQIAETVLVPAAFDEKKAALKSLINKCKTLNDDRVRIVHGLWVVTKKEGRLVFASRGQVDPKDY